MKFVFEIYETSKEANKVVDALMGDGISAYRQGTTVFVDDGGVDDAI